MATTITGSGVDNIIDGTITNADINASAGIVGSKINGSFGKLLQIVNVITTTQGSQIIVAASDTLITGMTKAITPVGANSKFLVQVRLTSEMNNPEDCMFNIQQDGTRVNVGTTAFIKYRGLAAPSATYTLNDSSTLEALHITTLVSTSSVIGTPITFRLVGSAYATKTLWINRTFIAPSAFGYEEGASEIIITEIGA